MSDGSFQVQHDDDEVQGLSIDHLDYSYEEYQEWQHLQDSKRRALFTSICLRVVHAHEGIQNANQLIAIGLVDGGTRRLQHHTRRIAMLRYAMEQHFKQ